MDRLRDTGKHSGLMARRLEAARMRALAARSLNGVARAGKSGHGQWDCDHLVTLRDAELDEEGRVPFHSRAIVSCAGGNNYTYVDLVAFDADATLTEKTLIATDSAESYADERHFERVSVSPTLATDFTRRLLLESLAIVLNDFTGEELITYVRTYTTPGPVPIRVELHHPRYAPGGPEEGDITSCHLRARDGCDYAVVTDDGEFLLPLEDASSGAATGVALRKTGAPWLGDRDHYFPFATGPAFDPAHVYVPTAFSLDLGMAPRGCRLLRVTEAKVQLIKTDTGGGCAATTDLEADLSEFVGERTATVSRLLDFTPVGRTGACGLPVIQGNRVRYSLSLAADVDCGEGPTPRRYSGWSGDAPGWSLRLLNTPDAVSDGSVLQLDF